MIPLLALAAAAADPDRPLAALATFPTLRQGTAQTAKPSAPQKPTRDQVLAAVKAEWPKYDTQHLGRLGPLEFSTWVMHANGVAVAPTGQSKGAGVKPVRAMNATARAFAAADADHDGGVTPDEMATFLMR